MNYDISRVEKLYDDLYGLLKCGDMNYHRFQNDDRLHPIFMDEKGYIGDKKWKQTHAEVKVKVSRDIALEIILDGQILTIDDVFNDERSSPAFRVFDIRSILIYPLFNNMSTKERVIGFICIPSVRHIRPFRPEEVEKCKPYIEEFNRDVIEAEQIQ